MKVYLKSGKSIRITKSIANSIWSQLDSNEDAKQRYIRLSNVNTGDTMYIIPVDEISCVK